MPARAVVDFEGATLNEGLEGNRNRDLRWLTGHHSGKPLSCHADNREGLSLNPNLLSDYVRSPTEVALPKRVAENGHGISRAIRKVHVFQGNQPPKKRGRAQFRIIIASNTEH